MELIDGRVLWVLFGGSVLGGWGIWARDGWLVGGRCSEEGPADSFLVGRGYAKYNASGQTPTRRKNHANLPPSMHPQLTKIPPHHTPPKARIPHIPIPAPKLAPRQTKPILVPLPRHARLRRGHGARIVQVRVDGGEVPPAAADPLALELVDFAFAVGEGRLVVFEGGVGVGRVAGVEGGDPGFAVAFLGGGGRGVGEGDGAEG